jgi:hypothetical protein
VKINFFYGVPEATNKSQGHGHFFNMDLFVFTLRHDKGTHKIMTKANSIGTAMHLILSAEKCPECAIISIQRLNGVPDTKTNPKGIGTSLCRKKKVQ